MRLALLAGIVAAVIGIGAGVGIGAAIWSGTEGAASLAPRALGQSRSGKEGPLPGRYDHAFSVYSSRRSLTWRPDPDASSCGWPYELKPTGRFIGGTGLWEYAGNAEINDDGGCYWKYTYLYWRNDIGGTLVLFHSQGSYGCEQNCRREGGGVGYMVYTG